MKKTQNEKEKRTVRIFKINRNTKERISLKKTQYMRTAIQNEWLRTESQKQEGQIRSTKKNVKK